MCTKGTVIEVSNFLVIAGMSGAGRSTAAGVLEDIGWFVIDNLPAELIPKVAELAERPSTDGSQISEIALVVGRSFGGSSSGIEDLIGQLRVLGSRVRVLFLDASNDELLARYEGTKRKHPLDIGGVVSSVDAERELLDPLKSIADLVIDTSHLSVHQLKARIVELFSFGGKGSPIKVFVTSFGYKYGIPRDADLVFDCRFLPNPHWVETLRDKTGREPEVRDYIFSFEDSNVYLEMIEKLLAFSMPRFVEEGKSYLTIAIGCTGGKHRSVALVEAVASELFRIGYPSQIHHRDIYR